MEHTAFNTTAYKENMAGWLQQQRFNFIVTLTFNGNASAEHAYGTLKRWHARMDRAMLGRYWLDAPAEQRLFSVFFMENDNGTRHWHGLARSNSIVGFADSALKAWKKYVPYGSAHIDLYDQNGNWAHYIVKRLDRNDMRQEFVISTQFMK